MAREKGSVNCHNYSFDSGISDDVLGCIRMTLLLDSYGLDNCGYCWAVAEDGIIPHHENCRLGNLQADADRRLELLKRVPEWIYDKDQECYFCEICGNNKNYGHSKSCELAKELADAEKES